MQNLDRIVALLKGYLSGNLTIKESTEVQQLLENHPDLIELANELKDVNHFDTALQEYEALYNEVNGKREQLLLTNILLQINNKRKQNQVRHLRRTIIRYSIVAVVFMVLVTGVFFLQNHDFLTLPKENDQLLSENFTPGYNKATLTSSNGHSLELSDTHIGIVVNQNIVYNDGTELAIGQHAIEHAQFTLSTPKGGQYQVTLADGTKVWLNAATILRYPQKFMNNQRTVELEGEAYFEVAKNERVPFIVRTKNESVRVLGTHFNISTYRDEATSTVSLLEGSVTVSLPNKIAQILKPGQQSIVRADRIDIQPVNTNEAIAWKNGEFMFNSESLVSAMNKIARWYDIEIIVEPQLKDIAIWGTISRNEKFDKVLELIKLVDSRIKFKVEGRRVSLMK
ncbi:FecR domain-containing protein [Olivibacter sp. CPCC 100613]|uniref:FecR family protein n=1 Tax=Olivibacter sp. CPCC 100613 TaxID=3079931 RepID=UPI002FFCC85E